MQATWTIVVTAAVSVCATLGTTWFGHWLSLSKDRALRAEELDRNARYIAVRVVCVLDPFVSGCVDVVHDEGSPRPPEGEFESDTVTPDLILPEDVDWRAIDTDLMYRILGMPNEIAVANQCISFVRSEISAPPDHSEYFWERSIRYGRLGLSAQNLADDLRARHGIPSQELKDWNPREKLELRLSKIEKQKADEEARQAGLMAKMYEEYATRQTAAPSTVSESAKS